MEKDTTEQAAREQELVDQVVASFADAADPRLQFVMQSLAKHLHAFIREVRLTEAEWSTAIGFLTEAGHITDENRQEFILLSDVLGASMQVVAINNEAQGNATEATVFGPFFLDDAPRIELGGDATFGASGEPCHVVGSVKSTDGSAIPGARVEVWEADEDGMYDVQYNDGRRAARAHLFTDDEGNYNFWGLVPTPYPIPHDGPVGRMLQATGRSPVRASHLHFMVTAAGYRTLVTHIFVLGDDQLEIGDSVFGVKESLIKVFTHHAPDVPTPGGRVVTGDWGDVRFDIVLAPGSNEGMRAAGASPAR